MQKIAAILSILFLANCGMQNEKGSEPSLVGGSEASEGSFPGVINIYQNCTAAKIGARTFITAAHCVLDKTNNNLRARFRPGQTMWVTDTRRLEGSVDWIDLTIDQTFTPSTYHDAIVACPGCNGLAKTASDVALIHVVEASPGIPTTQISFANVGANESVYVMGYGCESGYNGPAPSPSRLKYKYVRTLNKDSLNHANGYASATTRDSIHKFNFLTTGQDYSSSTGASICPGDSGGPVLKYIAGSWRVVGVNSYYSFLSGSDVAYTNWHTRFNDVSVRNWIQKNLHPTSCALLARRLFNSLRTGNRTVIAEKSSSKIRRSGNMHSSQGRTSRYFARGPRTFVTLPMDVAFSDRGNFDTSRQDRQEITITNTGAVSVKLVTWGGAINHLQGLQCYPEGLITGKKQEGNGTSRVNISLKW